jgi:diguanylate cyclase
VAHAQARDPVTLHDDSRAAVPDPWFRGRGLTERAALELGRDDAAAAREAAEDALAEYALGDPSAAPAWAAEQLVETHLLALRAAFLQDDVEAALRSGAAALELATRHDLARLAARAHNDLAAVYGARGLSERALQHLRAGVRMLDDAGLAVAPSLTNNLGNVYLELGRVDEALACFRRGCEEHLEHGDRFGAAIARSNEGRAAMEQGRHEEALTALREALAWFTELQQGAYRLATLAKLGEAFAAMGDEAAAEASFRDALDGLEVEGAATGFGADVRAAWGRFLLTGGRHEEALAALTEAIESYRRRGSDTAVVALTRHRAETLRRLGRLDEAYQQLESYLEQHERNERERGALMVRASLVELEAGLASDHQLHVVTREVLAEANRSLRDQAEQLERLSTTDELTGVRNRRYLSRRLEEESGRAAREDGDLALVLLDVDNFKTINDRHSHLVGDEVLARIAAVLAETVRRSDVVARWGGEEFALLLPGCDIERASVVAEKVRTAIVAHDWSDTVPGLHVTVSVGVACLREVGRDTLALVQMADRRLYGAKRAGRNRIESRA